MINKDKLLSALANMEENCVKWNDIICEHNNKHKLEIDGYNDNQRKMYDLIDAHRDHLASELLYPIIISSTKWYNKNKTKKYLRSVQKHQIEAYKNSHLSSYHRDWIGIFITIELTSSDYKASFRLVDVINCLLKLTGEQFLSKIDKWHLKTYDYRGGTVNIIGMIKDIYDLLSIIDEPISENGPLAEKIFKCIDMYKAYAISEFPSESSNISI